MVPPELACRRHVQPFVKVQSSGSGEQADALACGGGCRVPIVGGIPRFVSVDNYAAGFGLQWKAFRRTQLDSYTGTTISHDRLARCFGGSLDIVRGKTVLEAGCGAGRFTELLLDAGARVVAADLSVAVEANYDNCGARENYFVCQADLRYVPVRSQSFDFVMCIGVVQHTPDPEETIRALAGYLRPGGQLIIDHYTHSYPETRSRKALRRMLLTMPPARAKRVSLALASALVPLHRLSRLGVPGMSRIRSHLQQISPLVDYYDVYPELGDELLDTWAVLDTHDTLTDRYKHLRSAEEIARALAAAGLVDIEARYGGNGVEARARRPERLASA